jgi:putative flippase GtrA
MADRDPILPPGRGRVDHRNVLFQAMPMTRKECGDSPPAGAIPLDPRASPPSFKPDSRLYRFFAVAALNMAFGYSAFAFLLYLGLHYSAAALFGTFLGVLFNFQTTGRLVFRSRDASRIWRFIGVYVAVYLLNVLFLYVFHLFGVSSYIGGAILLVPMGLVAFTLQKRFVFFGEETPPSRANPRG